MLFVHSIIVCVPSPQASWSQSARTVAGSSSGNSGSTLSLLYRPIGMYYDQPNNNIIFSDFGNSRIMQFSLSNSSSAGTILAIGSTVGCGSPFMNVIGVAFDSSRQLYIGDTACFQLLRFPSTSNFTVSEVIATLSGTPELIFINPLTDDLYAAVYDTNSVVKFAKNSTNGVVVAGE